jgi:hypothetical protein
MESLENFWSRFRKAALARDAAAIRSMSAPTVIQRGSLDDTAVVRLNSVHVPAIVDQVLALEDGVDPAGRTQRTLLAAMPAPKHDPAQPPDYHRFGDLVFERGARGWMLTELYYDPE